jgi:hypothetical protein
MTQRGRRPEKFLEVFMGFLKAVLVGVAVFLGVQVGRDVAHRVMAATTATPATPPAAA